MTDADYDAHLDPWCIVPLEDGTRILFGFALAHEATAGLAWLSSSELLDIDRAAGNAVTRNGRHYLLGRNFKAVDDGGEGEEARLAFEVLVGPSFEDTSILREVDRLWMMASKAARHLGIEPPALTVGSTRDFFERQAAAYFAVRRRAGD